MQRSQYGMSLIEVLVTMVLITGGIVALVSFQSGSLKESSLSMQRLEATTLAQQQIENLRHYLTSNDFDNIITNSDLNDVANQVQGKNTTFTRTWDIDTMSNGDKKVVVTVTWPDQNSNGSPTSNTTIQVSSLLSSMTPDSQASDTLPTPLAMDVVTDTLDCKCDDNSRFSGGGHMGMKGSMTAPQVDSACDTCCGLTTSGSMGMMAMIHWITPEEFYSSLRRVRLPHSPAQSGWRFFKVGMMNTKTCDVYDSGKVMRK